MEDRLAKTRLTTPDTDLHVVEMTRGRFLVIRVAAAFGGLIVGPLYAAIFQVMGTGIPLVVPAIVGIGLAAAGWFLPASVINGKAVARRREMRYALVSYLTLVALHRAAGEGMTGALSRAAESSPAWTFRRIGAQVDSAMRSGMAAWDGLALLAVEMGIDELADLASIADVAGSQRRRRLLHPAGPRPVVAVRAAEPGRGRRHRGVGPRWSSPRSVSAWSRCCS